MRLNVKEGFLGKLVCLDNVDGHPVPDITTIKHPTKSNIQSEKFHQINIDNYGDEKGQKDGNKNRYGSNNLD